MGIFDARSISEIPTGGARHVHSLASLFDVAKTNEPAVGAILRFDGTKKLWSPSTVAIDDLSDVTSTTPATGQTLRWNGTAWVNANLALDDLSDAAVSAPATGQHIRFNGTTWVNALPVLDDASDVALTAPASGRVLRHNGTSWVDAVPLVADLSSVAWTTITPSMAQGATTVVGTMSYVRIGRLIAGWFRLSSSWPGTTGAALLVQCPVPRAAQPATSIITYGAAYLNLSPTGQFNANVCGVAGEESTWFRFLRSDAIYSNYVGIDPNTNPAAGVNMGGFFVYEAAT